MRAKYVKIRQIGPKFQKFVYVHVAPAETTGTMGKYDPDMGGVGMGPRIGPDVPVVFFPQRS